MLKKLARFILRHELERTAQQAASMLSIWKHYALLRERYSNELHEKHPDDQSFADWCERQPDWVWKR